MAEPRQEPQGPERPTILLADDEHAITPVLLLTQVGDAGERAMALEEGADDYLNKPFDPHELVARLGDSPSQRPQRTVAHCLERLLEVVWGWEYTDGSRAVDNRVAELRRALGQDAAEPVWLETTPGQGYRFIGDVRREAT